MSVRCYKNGNVHIKLNQNFALALNVEMGRLMGWVKNVNEASEEMSVNVEDISKVFGSNRQLLKSDVGLIA